MRIGFSLPQYGNMADATSVVEFASAVDNAGAESLWVGDRALVPAAPATGFGGGRQQPFPTEFRRALDPFAVLTAASACTRRAKIGTSVLNATWYQPLLLARALTTIDLLSSGRLLPGFGSGWSPDEFAALGIPMANRGARLDEVLDLLEKIWAAGITTHAGPLWTVPPSHFDLTTAQRPHPPIYLGGFTRAALSRVGQRADGWLPTIRLPDRLRVDQLSEMLSAVHAAAERAGRDPGDVDVILRVDVRPGVEQTQIIETIAEVEATTGINHSFVELLFLARDATEAIDVATSLLDASKQGA